MNTLPLSTISLLTTFSLTYESTLLKRTLRVTGQLLMDKGATLSSPCLCSVAFETLLLWLMRYNLLRILHLIGY